VTDPTGLVEAGELFGPFDATESAPAGGLTHVLEVLGSPEMQIAGAAGLVAAGSLAIARGVSSPTTPITITNLRLLPTILNATIRTSGEAIVNLPRVVGSGGSGVRSVGGAVADVTRPVTPIAERVTDPIREGFERVRRAPGEYANGDGRLLMQVGVVLGTIYAAFLTIWFWATRVRWNGGWRTGV
jgi:hypothetical protein